jgi:hypothetical protein
MVSKTSGSIYLEFEPSIITLVSFGIPVNNTCIAALFKNETSSASLILMFFLLPSYCIL